MLNQRNPKMPYIAAGLVFGCVAVGVVVSVVQAQTRGAQIRPVQKSGGQKSGEQPKTQPATKSTPPAPARSATQFDGLMGGQIDLASYRGKVVLVVNTASQCGFTGQYEGLERLYQARQRDGLVIVGVPSNDFGGQEPGSAGEIKKFCELNYGVSFPMADKQVVSGPDAHPFYKGAAARLGPSAEPAWNFHKILIDKNGVPIGAFASEITPNAPELNRAIDAALATPA